MTAFIISSCCGRNVVLLNWRRFCALSSSDHGKRTRHCCSSRSEVARTAPPPNTCAAAVDDVCEKGTDAVAVDEDDEEDDDVDGYEDEEYEVDEYEVGLPGAERALGGAENGRAGAA